MSEEVAATPGWVSQELDEIFAALPQSNEMEAARGIYAECLARSGSPAPQRGREFCLEQLIGRLRRAGLLAPAPLEALRQRLEALEAELDART